MLEEYYLISPRADGQETDKYLEKMFSQHIVMMGWGPDSNIGTAFQTLKQGTIVLVAQRCDWKFNYHFAGVISDDRSYDDEDGMQCRKLKHFIDLRKTSTDFLDGASFEKMQPMKAMVKIDPNRKNNNSVINRIYHIIQLQKQKEKMDNFISLLHSNKNLILTGAPGTGKTYLAKQIAAQMICRKPYETELENDDTFQAQCKFVQFHPSFDYTDFVEGLRPKKEASGSISFERKDGVFKAFCKAAVQESLEKGIDNFDESWDKLCQDIDEQGELEIPLLTSDKRMFVELNTYGNGLVSRTYAESDSENKDFILTKGGYIRHRSKFFNKEQLYNIYKGLSGVPSGGHDNYRKAIIKQMKEKYGLKPYVQGTEKDEANRKPFVMIIDEINRGEISKIFGELFFSIESGYRGIKGRVLSQYQNLVEPTDVFADGFYVPENVYIIGTMNDIDRSVESMDFAMRRRFAFKEIKASDTIEMIKSNDNLKEFLQDIEKRMKYLNLCILTIQGFSSAYQIGAAYFLKLANYLEKDKLTDKSWNELWNNHLLGLLFEYLRGVLNADEELQKLYRAYLLEDEYKLEDGKVVKVIKDE